MSVYTIREVSDAAYERIPWKDGGFDRAGCDCRGLALLWLREELGLELGGARLSRAVDKTADEILGDARWKGGPLERGDVVFFAHFKTHEIQHCAIYLGDNRYLHTFKGCDSRIVIGHTLLSRLQLIPAGAIGPAEADRLCAALADPKLGWAQVIFLVISIALSFASAYLTKRPRIGNIKGRYSDQSNATQTSPEIPLPDLLGAVVHAGNAIYTGLPDYDSTPAATSRWNKIVVLNSAPSELVDYIDSLFIDGISWRDKHWASGTTLSGFFPNPTQDKANAVTSTILGDTNTPNFTIYDGAHAISVPVDVRAQYDRSFPIYGLSGTSYLAFRLIDWSKLQSFNMTVRVKGRKCRTFDASGFIKTAVAGESLAGADGSKVRFKLANEDIVSVTAVTVNATAYSAISAAAQTGNVYSLNKLKGYLEFITAPAAAATVLVDYTFYPRAWSQNPASQVVYLLTESRRGKGYGEERIDWARMVEARDLCDQTMIWDGEIETRFQSNYAVDFRKPVQEHLRAILDACNGLVFLSSGRFVMKIRTPGSSVMDFGETKIMRDTFASDLVDRSDRANRIKLLFHTEESFNAETEVILDNSDDQQARESRLGNGGIKEQDLKLPAVTGQGQSERLAQAFLSEQIGAVHACEFTTNIKGLPLEPGDLITVTHSCDPFWTARLAWVDDLSYDQEDRLVLKCLEYFEPAFL